MQVSAYPHDQLADVFKATADPIRVRILALLIHAGELCVCHVETALDITQSRASRHLATLRRAGLVVDRKAGAWVHCRVPRSLDPIRRGVVRAIRDASAADPITGADVERATALRDDSGCGGAP